MDIDEIKRILKERGMTQEDLAKELCISYSSIRRILCGAATLTPQLSRHIEFVLGIRKSQMLMFTVELPDEQVREMVPGWDELSPEEQDKTGRAVIRHIMDEMIKVGEASLTPEERRKLKRMAGEA